MKLTDFYIQSNTLRLLLSLFLMIGSFLLFVPKPTPSPRKSSEVYSETTFEDEYYPADHPIFKSL